MTIVGSGKHTYELIEAWGTLPPGWDLGRVVAIAVDSQDRVYAFRAVKNPPADPPILVFDREGNYLNSWGRGAFEEPHGVYIGPDDNMYLADKEDHVTLKYTLGGKALMVLGNRGQPTDTGCVEEGGTVLRAGGPSTPPPAWSIPLPGTCTLPMDTAIAGFTGSPPRERSSPPGDNPARPPPASSTRPTASGWTEKGRST